MSTNVISKLAAKSARVATVLLLAWQVGCSGALNERHGNAKSFGGIPSVNMAALYLSPISSKCGLIKPGEGLRRGVSGQTSLASCEGSYTLNLQNDGNLVWSNAGTPLWSSQTAGSSAAVALMQTDGNLVIYDTNGNALWATMTKSNVSSLALQGDGNLVVYGSNQQPLWTSKGGLLVPAPTCGLLAAGQSLLSGQGDASSIASCDGRFKLTMQNDGNLVWYLGTSPLWYSSTVGRGFKLLMQYDGNLVLYDAANQPVWYSATAGHPGSYFALQNDGNLVVYGPDKTPLWVSGTTNVAVPAVANATAAPWHTVLPAMVVTPNKATLGQYLTAKNITYGYPAIYSPGASNAAGQVIAKNAGLQGDLYLPDPAKLNRTGANPTRPGLVILVHGGGWDSPTHLRDADSWYAIDLVQRLNLAVFNIDYRLISEGGGYKGPVSDIPEDLKDVKCGIQWIRKNVVAACQNLGYNPNICPDPSRFMVVGESAGGHLAMLNATMPWDSAVCGDKNAADQPSGTISYSGIADLTNWIMQENPGKPLNLTTHAGTTGDLKYVPDEDCGQGPASPTAASNAVNESTGTGSTTSKCINASPIARLSFLKSPLMLVAAATDPVVQYSRQSYAMAKFTLALNQGHQLRGLQDSELNATTTAYGPCTVQHAPPTFPAGTDPGWHAMEPCVTIPGESPDPYFHTPGTDGFMAPILPK